MNPRSRMTVDCAMKITDYYKHPDMRKHMEEFLEVDATGEIAARHIMGTDCSCSERRFKPKGSGILEEYMDRGFDISRSLLDTISLIAHPDIEYVNQERIASCTTLDGWILGSRIVTRTVPCPPSE